MKDIDKTKQQLVDEMLQLSQAKKYLKSILDTSVDGIVVSDSRGFITMANKAMENLLGYSLEELIGMHPTQLVPNVKKYQENAKAIMRRLLKEEQGTHFEHVWLRKDGSHVDIDLNAALLKDDKDNYHLNMLEKKKTVHAEKNQ